MTPTIQELKDKVNIVDVIGRYLALHRKGSEYVAMCCFHDDHKASLMVNDKKQVFKCFACGVGGDAIDFLVKKGRSLEEAKQELTELSGGYVTPRLPKKESEWRQLMPKDPVFKINHYKFGAPSKSWQYNDEHGRLIGYVCRFDLPDGKQTWPYTFCTDGKRTEWRWRGFDKPRSLYNLQARVKNPDKIVLIVEGEKTCDAAQLLFPEFVCMTWQGGARAVHNSNWTPLRGANVITWPDHDQPGREAMMQVHDIISEYATRIRTVELQGTFQYDTHWDLADFIGTQEQARELMKKILVQVKMSNVLIPNT